MEQLRLAALPRDASRDQRVVQVGIEVIVEGEMRRRGDRGPRRERREEIERLISAVDLAEHAGRKVRDFSGGLRQRVGIALALLGTPPILVVDKPTTGLDIEPRNRFRQILLEQAARRIVVFSTHIASDVEAAARRILLLDRGRLRFDGPPRHWPLWPAAGSLAPWS
jgi:ABC-2 type transport system ATP-binding protein